VNFGSILKYGIAFIAAAPIPNDVTRDIIIAGIRLDRLIGATGCLSNSLFNASACGAVSGVSVTCVASDQMKKDGAVV